MFKLFKKKTQQHLVKTPLLFTYKDKSGNRWFQYENILQLPAKRAIAAEVATRFAEMNLTKPILKELIAEMKKKANEGDIVSLFTLLNEIDFRLDFIGEEETLLELAACFFCIEGEDPEDFLDSYRKKKIEILKNDSDAKGFFLQRAFEHTTKFSNMSETIIQDYLNQNQTNAEKLIQTLLRSKSGNMSMKSTI